MERKEWGQERECRALDSIKKIAFFKKKVIIGV